MRSTPRSSGVLFDVYHAQVDRGNLIERFEQLRPVVAHVQIADNPGRGEPGTGEIAYERVLARIAQSGYPGWIGCEYAPVRGHPVTGLSWIERDHPMTDPKIALISATPAGDRPGRDGHRRCPSNGDRVEPARRPSARRRACRGRHHRAAGRAHGQPSSSSLWAGGADGVLLTCSQFGIRADRRDREADGVTVLSADGPLFAEAVAAAPARVLLVASLESSASDSTARLTEAFVASGSSAQVHPLVVPAAAVPLAAPDLIDALATAIADVDEPYDLIVLAPVLARRRRCASCGTASA